MNKWYEYKFQYVGEGECKNVDTVHVGNGMMFETLKSFKDYLNKNERIAWFGEFKEV